MKAIEVIGGIFTNGPIAYGDTYLYELMGEELTKHKSAILAADDFGGNYDFTVTNDPLNLSSVLFKEGMGVDNLPREVYSISFSPVLYSPNLLDELTVKSYSSSPLQYDGGSFLPFQILLLKFNPSNIDLPETKTMLHENLDMLLDELSSGTVDADVNKFKYLHIRGRFV